MLSSKSCSHAVAGVKLGSRCFLYWSLVISACEHASAAFPPLVALLILNTVTQYSLNFFLATSTNPSLWGVRALSGRPMLSMSCSFVVVGAKLEARIQVVAFLIEAWWCHRLDRRLPLHFLLAGYIWMSSRNTQFEPAPLNYIFMRPQFGPPPLTMPLTKHVLNFNLPMVAFSSTSGRTVHG